VQDGLRVVVVGAGAAGSAAAAAVRRAAPTVDVVVVGAEEWGPYNRTTVNKGLLSGAVDDAGIALPGMDRIGIDWRTGAVPRSLDARARIVELSDGSRLAGDAVVLATGVEARALPGPIEGSARERGMTLRTAADTARLRALIAAGRGRFVVAGAGLIGTETAAILLGAGCAVTLVDPAARPLARHVGRTVAGWVAAAHLGAGVDLRVETGVTGVRSIGTRCWSSSTTATASARARLSLALALIPPLVGCRTATCRCRRSPMTAPRCWSTRRVGRWSIVVTVVADVARACADRCTGRRS
jgi:3-phenylpropionate/trans-cinnamate dioxygenase ferredoxin reductase component